MLRQKLVGGQGLDESFRDQIQTFLPWFHLCLPAELGGLSEGNPVNSSGHGDLGCPCSEPSGPPRKGAGSLLAETSIDLKSAEMSRQKSLYSTLAPPNTESIPQNPEFGRVHATPYVYVQVSGGRRPGDFQTIYSLPVRPQLHIRGSLGII